MNNIMYECIPSGQARITRRTFIFPQQFRLFIPSNPRGKITFPLSLAKIEHPCLDEQTNLTNAAIIFP